MAMLKLTFLSLVIYVIGILWFLWLTQDETGHNTYMSENALLTGHVEPEFNDHSYSQKLYNQMKSLDLRHGNAPLKQFIMKEMQNSALDVEVHNFSLLFHHLLGQNFTGSNLCGIVRSPGIARTEALLLHAPLREDVLNDPRKTPFTSIAVMLALAKHMRSKAYWAKDIILLFTDMEFVGIQAWLDAYHGVHTSEYIIPDMLFTRSGSIQAALSLDNQEAREHGLDLRLPGVNGIMPNLDLVNNLVRNARGLDLRTTIHGQSSPSQALAWKDRMSRVRHTLQLMRAQASGSPAGLHGPLLALEIPSLTLLTSGSETLRLNKLALLLESTLRSLNNLEERLHQSFFFYLLPSTHRYISIGMYMLPFGCFLAALGIQVLYLWFTFRKEMEAERMDNLEKSLKGTITEPSSKEASSLHVMMHLCVVAVLALLTNVAPKYVIPMASPFEIQPAQAMLVAFASFQCCAVLYVSLLGRKKGLKLTPCNWRLSKCMLLLLWAIILGCLAIVNFSMAVFFALPLVPVLVILQPVSLKPLQLLMSILILLVSPFCLLCLAFLLGDGPEVALSSVKALLMHTFVEQCLLNSWSLYIGTLVILPAWSLLWGLAPLKSVT